jgi:murein DD-endopeptidase MepM/ murein hydrolase activator NlpD
MIKLQLPIYGAKLNRSNPGGITQFFGENLSPLYASWGLKGHNGLDFVCPNRTPILSAHDGIVDRVYDETNSSVTKGFGVYILHPEGWFTVYWHMLSVCVKLGETVKAGQPLGYSDNTGQSTGPHLHFGLYAFPRDMSNGYDGAIDPLPFLQIDILTKIRDILLQVLSLFKGRNK